MFCIKAKALRPYLELSCLGTFAVSKSGSRVVTCYGSRIE